MRIKQLAPQEAQKIAAGEVVERPANVVKELIENSLDAGATHITVYIEDGGKQLIRVVDNGQGMSAQDAHMSLKHHATSKITCVEDLYKIVTFGFRGEALSSISAVSNFVLTTKEPDAPAGVTLTVDATNIQETITACNTGTDITVEHLFYNIPARKKFLKTKETEWRAITQLFQAFCLSYQTVYFKLFHEEKLIYNCPPAETLAARLEQLYDIALTRHILLLEPETNSTTTVPENRMKLSISGAITDTGYSRYDRGQIFLFVNSRWVKNSKLSQALIRGYQNILQPQQYPAGFLFISIDPQFIDINIHPRKEEVLFLHPRIVETLIESTVKKRLEEKINSHLTTSTPKFTYATSARITVPDNPFGMRHITSTDTLVGLTSAHPDPSLTLRTKGPVPGSAELEERRRLEGSSGPRITATEKQQFNKILEHHFSPSPEKVPVNPAPENHQQAQQVSSEFGSQQLQQEKISHELNYTLLGQLFTTYILIETSTGLVLIDQHAAHERVIYESLKKNFNQVASVPLLFPHIIILNRTDIELLDPYLDSFTAFGLRIEKISETELVIQQSPVCIKNQKLDDIIKQAISLLYQEKQLDPAQLAQLLQEKVHAHLSCIAAVKAGDILTQESMREIISELYKSENKLTCPHGRPTIWHLSELEIEKKFKRDYRS